MGDTKTVWVKKEEIDEVQVYPSNVKIKEELQEDVNQEFPEDPLKFEKLDFNMNEGPEPNFHLDASEHNHVEVPFVLPVPTHIKEDPELNLEAEETENIEVAPRRCAPDSTCVFINNSCLKISFIDDDQMCVKYYGSQLLRSSVPKLTHYLT
ncbi:uncharacterized protein LOC126295241 isoform X3 [Schistocerca gregaria]|uniref:uncharacterized protein LOC126295241 isoform X3 n=1 Tax=Schistocerca gregaria TaxID=7010 RepID=UPI00211E11D2|nr:uncharacterized protein LOC126295241 isoform X3 [Schistocerca gregaria]